MFSNWTKMDRAMLRIFRSSKIPFTSQLLMEVVSGYTKWTRPTRILRSSRFLFQTRLSLQTFEMKFTFSNMVRLSIPFHFIFHVDWDTNPLHELLEKYGRCWCYNITRKFYADWYRYVDSTMSYITEFDSYPNQILKIGQDYYMDVIEQGIRVFDFQKQLLVHFPAGYNPYSFVIDNGVSFVDSNYHMSFLSRYGNSIVSPAVWTIK